MSDQGTAVGRKAAISGRRLIGWTLLALVLAGAAWWVFARFGPHIAIPADPAKIDEAVIVRLLRQELEDRKGNWENRNNTIGGHPWQLIPRGFWEWLFPVTYSEERIQALGYIAVDRLINVVRSSDDPALVTQAAFTLAPFDDERILSTFFDAWRRGRVTRLELGFLVPMHLPIARPGRWIPEDEVVGWLSERQGIPYDELRLELLDDVMKADSTQGGLEYKQFVDYRTIRWLNRIYDLDLDEWLARVSPRALAFRNEALRKGYDPVVVFERFGRALLDEGTKAVFDSSSDREACRELLEAVFNYRSPLHPPWVAGWQDRLRAWYWENRQRLVYDFERHRFVIRE
jgi:hypothetical protein